MTRDRLAALQDLLHAEVPISRHMGVVARDYDGAALTLAAALEPNINIHGTAFGGSLYSLAALSGWSLVRLRLEDQSLQAEVVLGSARIDYTRPVRSLLVARAGCESGGFEALADRVRQGRRASVEVNVELGWLQDGELRQAAIFTGAFATV